MLRFQSWVILHGLIFNLTGCVFACMVIHWGGWDDEFYEIWGIIQAWAAVWSSGSLGWQNWRNYIFMILRPPQMRSLCVPGIHTASLQWWSPTFIQTTWQAHGVEQYSCAVCTHTRAYLLGIIWIALEFWLALYDAWIAAVSKIICYCNAMKVHIGRIGLCAVAIATGFQHLGHWSDPRK